MTLNGVMAVTLRYFTEFGKPLFRDITDHVRSPDEFFVCCLCRLTVFILWAFV